MALSKSEILRTFGNFGPVRDNPDVRGGVILPRPWIDANLVYIEPPWALRTANGKTASRVRCHRRIAHQLLGAFQAIARRGLQPLVMQYNGCWTPRHVMHDPARPLSRHTWGIAIDFNASQFPYGSQKKQDARLVQIMADHGFENGAGWATPDPMHFEAAVLMPAIIVGDEVVGFGRLEKSVTWVPLRVVAESLGARVSAQLPVGEIRLEMPEN